MCPSVTNWVGTSTQVLLLPVVHPVEHKVTCDSFVYIISYYSMRKQRNTITSSTVKEKGFVGAHCTVLLGVRVFVKSQLHKL
jgi:hypothetical protein